MPGFVRDLAAVDPWDASLERSRSRRARSRRPLGRRRGAPSMSASETAIDAAGRRELLSFTWPT